jgi:hypothetical protein
MQTQVISVSSIKSLKQAKSIAGSLGFPSKMPGTSYGISAKHCKTGSKLAKVPGSVCEKCYAMRDNYVYPSVMAAHETRLAALESPQWVDAIVLQIVKAALKSGVPYHRWHDSGDLQSMQHLLNIVEVARRLPDINFWLPTKEKQLVNRYLREHGDFPANLCVRLSAAMIDGLPPVFANTSTVIDQRRPIGYPCPAPTQGRQCGSCRACWDRRVANVTYHKH